MSYLWKIWRGEGYCFLEKIQGEGGGRCPGDIPSMMGVWIFSGTTQCLNYNK